MRSMYSKIHDWYLGLGTIFIVIMSCFFTYLYCIDGVYVNQPITYYEDFITEKSEYTAGEDIYANWHNCVGDLDRGPATVEMNFVDGLIYTLPLRIAFVERELGCSTLRIYMTTVPKKLPVGEYYLDSMITYNVNKVRDVSYHRKSNKFKVIE